MHISRVDLNLLVVLDTIYTEGGITKAAEKLHLTQPAISHALARLRDLPEGIRDNSGAKLLELIHAAGVPQPPAPLPQRRRPDPERIAAVTRLVDLTRQVGSRLRVAPEILATRRELERLAAGERDGTVLRGWRREVIGAELLRAL